MHLGDKGFHHYASVGLLERYNGNRFTISPIRRPTSALRSMPTLSLHSTSRLLHNVASAGT